MGGCQDLRPCGQPYRSFRESHIGSVNNLRAARKPGRPFSRQPPKMAVETPMRCAACGDVATTSCTGCKGAPEYHPNDALASCTATKPARSKTGHNTRTTATPAAAQELLRGSNAPEESTPNLSNRALRSSSQQGQARGRDLVAASDSESSANARTLPRACRLNPDHRRLLWLPTSAQHPWLS